MAQFPSQAIEIYINPPYFEHKTDAQTNQKNVSSLTDEFKIFDLTTIERVNHLSLATVKAIVPSDLLKDTSQGSLQTTEDFFSSQMFKHVSICMDRPTPEYVPLELFQLKTWFHGILTKSVIEITPFCDVVTIELRPYFWLLTQQNNYRSFPNQTVKEMSVKKILEAIFLPYKEEFLESFEIHHDYLEMPLLNQLMQTGESDFDFVMRIFERTGLSYFFYHDEKTCHLVITDKLSTAFDNIHKKFSNEISADGAKPLSNPLKYVVLTGEERIGFQVEGTTMPLLNFKMFYESPTQQLKVQTFPEYRSTTPTVTTLLQEGELPSKADGFKPTQYQFVPMSTVVSAKTQDKMDHVVSVGTHSLERDFSSKLTYFANTESFGFIPMWRKLSVDVNLTGKRKHQNLPVNYVSHLQEEHNFLPSALMHHFACQLESYLPHFNINRVSNRFATFYVSMNFFKEGDDKFRPPLEVFHAPPLVRHEKTISQQLFSAVVVKFEDNDKTENDFDVPNTIRVCFPWHKEGESVKARVSFFWAGNEYGSLFLPEEGSEVIVTFLAGDPDYPMILGSCYNSVNNYPLGVKKREVDGPFGARGVVFKDSAAEFVFETVKDKNDQKTQILTLSTADGNLAINASNIETKAKKSIVTSVTDAKSSLKMDDKVILVNAFDNNGTITLQKGGKTVITSSEISMDADAKMGLTAPAITANSLKLPG